MEPTTTRGNWTIDNRTGVIGHATRDFGIDFARSDTRTDLVAKLAQAFSRHWITDTERHDLVLLMAKTCGVRPDDPWEASYAAEARLETCARQHINRLDGMIRIEVISGRAVLLTRDYQLKTLY